jgi:hypothetical protein
MEIELKTGKSLNPLPSGDVSVQRLPGNQKQRDSEKIKDFLFPMEFGGAKPAAPTSRSREASMTSYIHNKVDKFHNCRSTEL